jgi:SM-20-related protein
MLSYGDIIEIGMDNEIHVIDDFLPIAEANLFHDKFFSNPNWKAMWNQGLSTTEKKAWNWHRSVALDLPNMGSASQEYLDKLDPEILLLWEHVDAKIKEITGVKHYMSRHYSNSHTYGMDGSIHTDDGDITVLYYPCKNWQTQWEGGTSFYTPEWDDCIKYASYKFNRLILFKASIPHRAMPVTRECHELRTSVVFKTNMDTNDPSYFEWYNNRRRT